MDADSDPGSPELPCVPMTMPTNRNGGGDPSRQLFSPSPHSSDEDTLADISNSEATRRQRQDYHMMVILQAIKKQNDRLGVISTRIEAVEDQLKSVEKEISTPTSSASSSCGKKKKVPARVRVSNPCKL